MRKPRDYDAELKALDDKARQLKVRKVQQLGELVIATGADALPVEELAGALLLAVGNADPAVREAQRTKGATFFQGKEPAPAGGNRAGAPANARGAASAAGEDRA
jgi:hypothetical protein